MQNVFLLDWIYFLPTKIFYYLRELRMNDKKPKEKSPLEKLDLTISERQKDKYVLRLYITGSTSRSVLAITNLKKICREYLEGRYELEVIDLFQHPGLAVDEQIIAAPTLIKKLPLPFRRIIGDMSNKEKVLLGLDLKELKNMKDSR
jgi:circadian clock protein KaiB